MTPEEIDEAVARKLGWTRYPGNEFDWLDARGTPMGGLIQHQFSANIEAAWEIFESLDKRGHYIIAFKDKWHCQLVDGNSAATELADTAPMAICLAFLKLSDEPTCKL